MKILKIDREPFTQLHYNDRVAEEYWSHKIQRCSNVAGYVEISLVENGYREAATLNVKADEMEVKRHSLREKGLIYTPIKWVKFFNGFSHKHRVTTPDDPEALCYGVVTRTETAAKRFKDATLRKHTDHDVIGGLLGYPPCCRNFFCTVWRNGFVDPIWQQAINTKRRVLQRPDGGHMIKVEGYPECVAMQRYWGIRISFHLPCSFTCDETRKIAGVWLKEFGKFDPIAPSNLIEILSLPTVWDAYRGVAAITTSQFKGIASSVPCADIYTVYYTSTN